MITKHFENVKNSCAFNFKDFGINNYNIYATRHSIFNKLPKDNIYKQLCALNPSHVSLHLIEHTSSEFI